MINVTKNFQLKLLLSQSICGEKACDDLSLNKGRINYLTTISWLFRETFFLWDFGKTSTIAMTTRTQITTAAPTLIFIFSET